MITETVRNISNGFREKWAHFVPMKSALRLDGSWPSVGVLDQLTFSLRTNAQLTAPDRALLRFTAAYLGTLAHECWSGFGVDVTVDLNESGVFISADAQGPNSRGRLFLVNIERELLRCLQSPQEPFPVIADFARYISPDQNILSSFALGLVTGLTPFGEGPWLQESTETFRDKIESATKILARSSASYYEAVFPKEQLGQVAELYLNSLIYPPAMMGEDLPACNAVRGIITFCKEYGVRREGIRLLAHNLALSPDDLVAQAGLALYAAITNTIPPPEIIAVAEGRGTHMGVLRAAMVTARETLGMTRDWIAATDVIEGDAERYIVEMSLGFLPWMRLSKEFISTKAKSPRIRDLCLSLASFQLRESISILDDLISETPGVLDLRLQRAYLDLIAGDPEKANHAFRTMLSEPGAEDDPRLFGLWGLCELARGDTHQAERHFANAYQNTSTADSLLYYQVSNNYAWALILLEDYDRAVNVLDQTIKKGLCPVTALLNKAFIHRILEEDEPVLQIQAQLLSLCPLDRRVFGNLLSTFDIPIR